MMQLDDIEWGLVALTYWTFVSPQAAYIYQPSEDEGAKQRPAKKRRVGKAAKGRRKSEDAAEEGYRFTPLLSGSEEPVFVKRRQELFESQWEKINDRIQVRDIRCGKLSRPPPKYAHLWMCG